MPLLSFRFAPRTRALSDPKLYVPLSFPAYEALLPLVGGTLNVRPTLAYWGKRYAWPRPSSRVW